MGKFKSFEEFKADYEKYHYIDKVSNRYYPRKVLNEKQLKTYYLQYVKKHEKAVSMPKAVMNKKSDDLILYEKVLDRDKGCRLVAVLSPSEREVWGRHHNGMGKILDGAHVFGKNAYPWMRYELKNVITINRFSHSCLDLSKSPLDGHSISADEKGAWWKRIVGEDYRYLELLSRKKVNILGEYDENNSGKS